MRGEERTGGGTVASTVGQEGKKTSESTGRLMAQLDHILDERTTNGNNGLFRRDRAKHVVTVRLTEQDHQRLLQLKDDIEATSLSEVILQALATLDFMAEQFQLGREIQIVEMKTE
ncbi:hypothetical protein ACFLS0_00585 [Candidatus Bipolaricaulota bacterium]